MQAQLHLDVHNVPKPPPPRNRLGQYSQESHSPWWTRDPYDDNQVPPQHDGSINSATANVVMYAADTMYTRGQHGDDDDDSTVLEPITAGHWSQSGERVRGGWYAKCCQLLDYLERRDWANVELYSKYLRSLPPPDQGKAKGKAKWKGKWKGKW